MFEGLRGKGGNSVTFAKVHTAYKWQSLDSNSGNQALECVFLTALPWLITSTSKDSPQGLSKIVQAKWLIPLSSQF